MIGRNYGEPPGKKIKKLRLIRVPALPLSLSVAIFPSLFALIVEMGKLRELSFGNDRLSTIDNFSALGRVFVLTFLTYFIAVLVFAVVLNWALRCVGGLQFEVIDGESGQ